MWCRVCRQAIWGWDYLRPDWVLWFDMGRQDVSCSVTWEEAWDNFQRLKTSWATAFLMCPGDTAGVWRMAWKDEVAFWLLNNNNLDKQESSKIPYFSFKQAEKAFISIILDQHIRWLQYWLNINALIQLWEIKRMEWKKVQ